MILSKRQEQILQVSIKIIATQGIQNFTTKNLAKEIGISEPALYRHYRNKLAIMKGVIRYFRITMKPAFQQVETAEKSLEKLESFFLNHLQIFNQNPHIAKVIFSEANFQNEEELINMMNSIMNQSQQKIREMIGQGQQSGEISKAVNSLNLSRIIIGTLRFLIIQWTMSGLVFDLEAEGNALWQDIKNLIMDK
ncbi:MAG: TetR/AcrR family transcriptional regulator [Candidatus Cloacimonadales bacterium]